jgi:hypothetical protein
MKRKLNEPIKNNLSIITKRTLIFFIIFTLFFTISSLVFSLSSPWPMFRHDPQRTGRSPYKGTDIDMLKWNFETGGDISSSPAIGSDGTIYVGSADKYFYAINSNGTMKWNFETGGDISSSPAIGSDGTIYVTTTSMDVSSIDKNVYAINSNGILKWLVEGGGAETSPAVGSDGTIYVGSADGYLYAISPNGILKMKADIGWGGNSSPAIGFDGTIFVGGKADFYAINPNGSLKWKFEIGSLINSSPAIGSDGTIYFGSNDHNLYAIGGTESSPQISEATYFLKGSLHCPETRGYLCNGCSSASGYINHFKGFNVLTTNEDCYVNLTYNQGDYIGNQSNCEVTIKGEKWLGLELENESGTKLVEEINSERFNFQSANKFVERTMNFPGENYQYEFANEGKEFRLYLSRDREEAFKAVPWQNMVIEIKNKETNNIFKYKFEKGIFPLAYSWNSGGMANYGQCVWWAAKRWVEEVDSKTLFPFNLLPRKLLT